MTHYSATLARDVTEYAEVTFEAVSHKAAMKEARRMLRDGEGRWRVGGDTEGEHVVILTDDKGRLIAQDFELD